MNLCGTQIVTQRGLNLRGTRMVIQMRLHLRGIHGNSNCIVNLCGTKIVTVELKKRNCETKWVGFGQMGQ